MVMVDRINEAFGQVALITSDLPAPAANYEPVYG
jgi:hypothetical protein